MLLSVIIPVYRVEATLDRCVESVLRQRVEDMEVILVDDGSPDNCPKMCNEWAKRDQRIRVIHQENGGLSDARNAGIDISRGQYITFIDSDDWISDNTYPPLLVQMDDIDILEYGIADKLSLQEYIYDDVNEYWLKEKAYTHTYACNKIYRKSLFNDVRFPKGRIFEDVYTFPLLLQKVKRIATTSHGSYHYWMNPSGITASADGHALAQLLDAYMNCKMPIDDSFYMYMVNIQISVWEQTKEAIVLPKRKVGFSLSPSKFNLKAIILNTLGISILCRLCKFLHYFKEPSRI